jgi:hypothetical protein
MQAEMNAIGFDSVDDCLKMAQTRLSAKTHVCWKQAT